MKDEQPISERQQALETQHENAQRNMCYISIAGMMLYPSLVVISDMLGLSQAAQILGAMSSVYYVSVAGLVSVWFGVNSWNNRNSR